MARRSVHLYNFRGLLLVAVGFIGLALFAMGYTIWKLRSDAIDDAFKDGGNIAIVLAEQTAQTVRSIDLVLTEVRDRIELHGVTTSDEVRRTMATEYGHTLLKNRLDRFPVADVIFVTDSDGRVLSNSRMWPTLTLDFADRDYFTHFKDSQESKLHISLPVINRVTGTPSVFFSKPIRGPGDVFLGIVTIGVQIAQFRHIYETIGLLGDQAFMFARTDGTILVRYPGNQDRIGQKIAPEFVVVCDGCEWWDHVSVGGALG